MQIFGTKTGRIQQYIKEILDDGAEHKTKEISDYVDKRLQENGEFIFQVKSYVNNAMRVLMADGKYVKVALGVYQKDGIPYTPTQRNKAEHHKNDFMSVMQSVKTYARDIRTLFATPSFMDEMSDNEQKEYHAITEQALNIADKLKFNADKLLHASVSNKDDGYNETIRAYFKELLSDGEPHKMKEIQDYVFKKMRENNESRDERNSCYVHFAIKNLISDDGPYQKISRGFYQKADDSLKNKAYSTYSMDDVLKLLDKGFEISNSDLNILFAKEYCKNGNKEFQELGCELRECVESSIDNISCLMAFAEDYMDQREENEQSEGMTMS